MREPGAPRVLARVPGVAVADVVAMDGPPGGCAAGIARVWFDASVIGA